MDINLIFGKKVKKLREEYGYSQEKLANLSNIDRTYLPAIEKGTRNISLQVAAKIAKALNTELYKLLKDGEDI